MSDQTLTPETAIPADDAAREQAGIATEAENAELEHVHSGTTTRADRLDAGVPMLQGSPAERQGPEDALGPGPKRGDYTKRIGPNDYNPTQTVIGPDGMPHLVDQRTNAEIIGDSPGKGGVDTAEARAVLASTRDLPAEMPPGYVPGERVLFDTKADGTGIDWGTAPGVNPVAPQARDLTPAVDTGAAPAGAAGNDGPDGERAGRQGRGGRNATTSVGAAVSTGDGEPRTPDGDKATTNLGTGGND